MDDAPVSTDPAPHVREPCLHWRATILRACHEGVHTRVEVRVSTEALHVVGRYLAHWQALHESHEVAPCGWDVADEVWRHCRKKGEV